jgi:hypothetical protein
MEMDRDSFAEQVMSRVGNMLGGGHDIRIHRAGKNNGVYRTGLQITGNGLDIAPVFYIDRYYGLYEKGEETIDSVAARVMDTYNRERSGGMMQVDMRKFLSYERVRETIVYKLVSTGKNRELLEDVPHVDFMDLSIIFQCLVSREGPEMATILVHNVHMKLWDVTTEELHAAAEENTRKLLPYEIKSMTEVLHEIMETEDPEQSGHSEFEAELADNVPMYVLSNKNRVEGAACMLYPGLIRDLADKFGKSFYIIPSSVHEVLILPTEDIGECAGIKSMIREINDTQVSPEEILSYSLYYYDREEGKIMML